MKTAFVTGANGHIGANLVRELLNRDYRVTALVRDRSDLRGLEGLEVELVRGDVLDEASLEPARACETLFHLGAPYSMWAKDPGAIIEPAVRGTENVLRAAPPGARVVVTSSCNVVGFTRGEPLDESTWRDRASSPYMQAKLSQERRARSLAEELGIDLVTVLPTAVLGPYDFKKTPTTGPFLEVFAGKSPIPFATNLVDVRDVALGHVLAAERGARLGRYLLGGDNVSMPALAALIEKLAGRRPQEGLPPTWVLRAVATVSEAVSALSGKPPMITRAILDDVAGGAPLFDISRARAELGYRPRGAEEVLVATIEWAERMQWLPKLPLRS